MHTSLSKKILNLPRQYEDLLARNYSREEARSIAFLVMEHLSAKQIALLLSNDDQEWTAEQFDELDMITRRLTLGEPLQYVLGYTDFAGQRFLVHTGVLIPRGETEELLEWVSNDLQILPEEAMNGLQIMDVGCGSGCIGISIAKAFPTVGVTCADLYPAPLNLTRENAQRLGVRLEVRKLDLLKPDPDIYLRKFSLLVSNPPYVTQKQKQEMSQHVVDFEPSEALFVPDEDPLVFYRAIVALAIRVLQPDGSLYLEINEVLGNETKMLLQSYFDHVELREDIHGKPRMIKAYGRS